MKSSSTRLRKLKQNVECRGKQRISLKLMKPHQQDHKVLFMVLFYFLCFLYTFYALFFQSSFHVSFSAFIFDVTSTMKNCCKPSVTACC